MYTVTIYPRAAGAAPQPIPNVVSWQRIGNRLVLTRGSGDSEAAIGEDGISTVSIVPWINLDAVGVFTVWDHDRPTQPPLAATKLVTLINAHNESVCSFFASDFAVGDDGRPDWHIPEASVMQVPWVSVSYLQRVEVRAIDPAVVKVNIQEDEAPAGPAHSE